MPTEPSHSNHRRLGEFFRARRQQTRPEDVGLPVSSRRRTPGLRREEVAVLANVGVSWYTWLEQGRAIGASEEILDAIADALKLSSADRTHVRRLATGRRRAPEQQPDPRAEFLQQLVDGMANPSYVSDPFWSVVAMNRAATEALATRVGESCLERFFSDPKLAGRHVHQELMARSLVAQFRAQSALFPDDPGFEETATRLAAISPEFRRLWESQVVGDSYHVDLVYDHPRLGRLSFEPLVLTIPDMPGLRLFTYLPRHGTRTQAALQQLRFKAAQA